MVKEGMEIPFKADFPVLKIASTTRALSTTRLSFAKLFTYLCVEVWRHLWRCRNFELIYSETTHASKFLHRNFPL